MPLHLPTGRLCLSQQGAKSLPKGRQIIFGWSQGGIRPGSSATALCMSRILLLQRPLQSKLWHSRTQLLHRALWHLSEAPRKPALKASRLLYPPRVARMDVAPGHLSRKNSTVFVQEGGRRRSLDCWGKTPSLRTYVVVVSGRACPEIDCRRVPDTLAYFSSIIQSP